MRNCFLTPVCSMLRRICFFLIVLCFNDACFAQNSPDTITYVAEKNSFELTEKQCARYNQQNLSRITKLSNRMRSANNRYLHRFMKEEDAILHSLCSTPRLIHTVAAYRELQNNPFELSADDTVNLHKSESHAEALMMDAWYCFNRFENKCTREVKKGFKLHFAELDSLDKVNSILMNTSLGKEQCTCKNMNSLGESRNKLSMELRRSELIKQYIDERIIYLHTALNEYPGTSTLLMPIMKCSYYFTDQITEYKTLFTDRSSVEKLVMKNLEGLQGTGSVFKKDVAVQNNNTINGTSTNSNFQPKLQLEDLFKGAPKDTKSALITILENNEKPKMPSAVKSATNNINEISDAITNEITDSLSQDVIATDSLNLALNEKKTKDKSWKPNPLKTKRKPDRINIGANFQLDPRTASLPSSSVISASISYQCSPNCNMGIGASYIQPLPLKNSNNESGIHFPASPSYGMRSYIDIKVHKSIFIQGGYERNYRSYSESNFGQATITPLTCLQSALVGVKVKYPVKNKQSRPTLEILYDFLSAQTGQPAMVVRFGIEFNRKHSSRN